MEVVVGTYEGFVLGYKLRLKGSPDEVESDDGWQFDIDFADKCHSATVKCLGGGDPRSRADLVASGSADETVAVFDMRKRKCVGVLQEHSSTVTAIAFYRKRVALTAGEDGRIVIWNANDWTVTGELRGHVGAVNCIAIHPSGKLALSVGKDKTLRTWNLLRGRSAYVTNLKSVVCVLAYSASGDFYALGSAEPSPRVDVYSVASAGVIASVPTFSGKRVLDLKFAETGKEFAFTADSEIVEFVTFSVFGLPPKVRRLTAHEPRAKGLGFGSLRAPSGFRNLFVTCGSEGSIKLWDYASKRLPSLLASVATNCRPTCLFATSGFPLEFADEVADPTLAPDEALALSEGLDGTEEEMQNGDEDESEEDDPRGWLEKVAKCGKRKSKQPVNLSRKRRSALKFHTRAREARRRFRIRLARKLLGG